LISGSKMQMETVSCGVCHSTQSKPYASGQDFEYSTSEVEFQMVECVDCENVYLNPRPSSAELGVIYPPNYYSYNYDDVISPVARFAKDKLDRAKVESWLKLAGKDALQFLDVGCGNGRYLEMLSQLGVAKEKLYGVEMSTECIDHLKSQGFNGLCGRIEDVEPDLPVGQFDLIVLLQVIEHVEDPAKMVAVLSRLLKSGGILVIETPNTRSLDVSLFRRRYWGGYHFPRHWNLFNQDNLSNMVQANGLTVKSIKYLPAHTFWIYSLHHFAKDKLKSKLLANWLNPFQNVPLLCIFTGFDLVRAKLGSRTSNMQVVAQRP